MSATSPQTESLTQFWGSRLAQGSTGWGSDKGEINESITIISPGHLGGCTFTTPPTHTHALRPLRHGKAEQRVLALPLSLRQHLPVKEPILCLPPGLPRRRRIEVSAILELLRNQVIVQNLYLR